MWGRPLEAPSVACDASCPHAIRVYHKPQGVAGTDQTTAYRVGPITCAVSENVPVRPGRLRLTGAPQEKRHENGVIGSHNRIICKSHARRTAFFPDPLCKWLPDGKYKPFFCFFSAFTRQIGDTCAYLCKASSIEKRAISGGGRLFIMVHTWEVGGCIPLLPQG